MNEIEKKEEPKMLLSVMLDMAKAEIGGHVSDCMESNHIPPDLMILVVKEILLDLNEKKIKQLQQEIAEMQMQRMLKGSEEKDEHD